MTVFEYLKYTWPHIQPFFTDPAVRNAVWQIWFNRDYTAWASPEGQRCVYPDQLGHCRADALLRPQGYCLQTLAIWYDPAANRPTDRPVCRDHDAGHPRELCWVQPVPHQASSRRRVRLPWRRMAACMWPIRSITASSISARMERCCRSGANLRMCRKGLLPAGPLTSRGGWPWRRMAACIVADTWNYRIQKFTSDGKFLLMWGSGPADGTGSVLWSARPGCG